MIHGTATLKSKSSSISICEGDIFFIPKGLKYQSFWYGDDKERITFDSFGFEYFPIPNTSGFMLQKIECTDDAASILVSMSGDIPTSCTSVGNLYTFLGLVLNSMKREIVHYKDITELAMEYMRTHTHFQMTDVAKHCGVSRTSLYEILKKAYQKTPIEIKQEILCEKAVELLTTTDFSVEEISARLNFSSSSYFRKILKKHTGKSPLEMRKDSQF